ncbi:MAG: hypothetical protein PHF00_04710, partial [Elusimicrobia bacterium]|nr:hypothetical protein [Elusimicrobiota bacterium]
RAMVAPLPDLSALEIVMMDDTSGDAEKHFVSTSDNLEVAMGDFAMSGPIRYIYILLVPRHTAIPRWMLRGHFYPNPNFIGVDEREYAIPHEATPYIQAIYDMKNREFLHKNSANLDWTAVSQRTQSSYAPNLPSRIDSWSEDRPLVLDAALRQFPDVMAAAERARARGVEVTWDSEPSWTDTPEGAPYKIFFDALEDRLRRIPGCVGWSIDPAQKIIEVEFENRASLEKAVTSRLISATAKGPYNLTYVIKLLIAGT